MSLRFLIPLAAVLLAPAVHAAQWGSVSQRCEGETTVYFARVDAQGGSWEEACQGTAFRTPGGASVTFVTRDASAKNYACSGSSCRCTGGGCDELVSMKCVHRGSDGMWGEVRVRDAACRAAGTWGDFAHESCAGGTSDKYFAKLHVSKGEWEAACRNTPAQINDHLTVSYDPAARAWRCEGTACLDLDRPRAFSARCVNRQTLEKGMAGMWLEASLGNAGCPAYWGDFAKTCPEVGTAEYEARLEGVPDGESWEDACVSTPADYDGNGVSVRPNADQCVKDSLFGTGVGSTGMWSRFRAKDEHCVATLPDIQRIWMPDLTRLSSQSSASTRSAPVAGRSVGVSPSSLDVQALVAAVSRRHAGEVSQAELAGLVSPGVRTALPTPAARTTTALSPASASSDVARPGLIYTIGGAVSGGLFFGLAAEQGIAAWFDARENLRGYTTFGHSRGVQAGAGGEGVFGIWVVNDLHALAGDAWGCSVGASTPAGAGAAFTAWFDYQNRYLGSTLAPGVSVGLTPVEANMHYVHTFLY